MTPFRSTLRASAALLAAVFAIGCGTDGPVEGRVFLLEGERLVPVRREVGASNVEPGVLESLLAGPTTDEKERGLSTEIPPGTRLLAVSVRDGTAIVDLSSELHRGGGSLSMRARLAQLVFTVTEIPGVERMELWIEGEPVPYLGGEGILTEGPLTRERFDDLAPSTIPGADPG